MLNRFISTKFFSVPGTGKNNNEKSLISTGGTNMSLYNKYNTEQVKIQNAVPNACHNIIKTSCPITKRIPSKKLCYSDHARFFTKNMTESSAETMRNEISDNECVNNICNFNHNFFQTTDPDNQSYEGSESYLNELVNNQKSNALYVYNKSSQRNNRRRQKRALRKGMHTTNCKASSTTDL
ncbi:unnamed protein product [Rotaria sp. Silwood2]|nr:unnamed protein product [Rotaria sp. Silwood2]CAF3047549.1 unnamed protein product [Rotaria sp. Silwood2]CAF3424248.1 unnamed protein product [Rotaria sp. Silwood2]CAF4344998.1 unnamed protein product [Rotaria sp. Silwood2]CAF4506476.1 unnamed protein product [Rotaria sp. Silwood2]